MCARVCVRIVKTWPLAEIMFTVGFTPLAQATSMIQIAEIRPRVHPIYIPFSFFYYCLLFIPLRDPSLSLFLLAAYSPLLPPLPLLLSSFFLFFFFSFLVHPYSNMAEHINIHRTTAMYIPHTPAHVTPTRVLPRRASRPSRTNKSPRVSRDHEARVKAARG